MKNKIKKISSITLSSIMLFSSVSALSGCNSKKTEKGRETVAEDSVWFDTKKIKLESPYSADEVSELVFTSAIVHEDSIYALVSGAYNFDYKEAISNPDFDYNSILISSICEFDMDGNLIKEIPVDNNMDVDIVQGSSLALQGDKIRLNCIGGDANSEQLKNYYAYVDVDNETFDFHEYTVNVGEMSMVQSTVDVGDYSVCLLYDYSTEAVKFYFAIVKDDEVIKTININEELGEVDTYVDNMIVLDDNTVAFTTMESTAELNVSEGKITESDTQLNLDNHYFQLSQDGRSFSVEDKGIFTVDENLEVVSAMDFSCANVNVSDVAYGQVIYQDDNKIIEYSNQYNDSYTFPDTYVYIFEKAETNPNAGKKILNVYSLGNYINYSQAEAIVRFNETNEEYFAKISFADSSEIYEAVGDDTEGDSKFYEAVNKISDQLMMDLMNGDGPDVVLGGYSCSQLNNPEYLVDLNDFINGENGIDKSQYFANIFDASVSEDGKLYQIPVCFDMNGIMAPKCDVGDEAGFTFDNYKDFVSDKCNGENPINMSSSDFLVKCLSYGYVEYIKDGKINLDTEEFRALAEFAKENLPETFVYEDEYTGYIIGTDNSDNKPQDVNFFEAQYAMNTMGPNDPKSLYGYPSSNGMGPVAAVTGSAAISAATDEETKNAAWDFIKSMLDEEVQVKESSANPININAFNKKAENAVAACNSIYDLYIQMGMGEAELKLLGAVQYPDSLVDDYIAMANKVNCVERGDTSLTPILYEEIGAYFADQKSLDEVIGVINDRAQKMLDERAVG